MSKAQDTCSLLWGHLGSNTESAGERPCVLRPPQRRGGGQWGVEQHTANLAPLYSELMEFNFLKLNFTYLLIFACAGSSLRLYRLLTQWALLLQGTGCRHAGFSSCNIWTQQLWHTGCRCSEAGGLFPNQGLNPGPLHWQADGFLSTAPLQKSDGVFFKMGPSEVIRSLALSFPVGRVEPQGLGMGAWDSILGLGLCSIPSPREDPG